MYTRQQKIFSAGNSAGIVVDSQFLAKAGISKGQTVDVRYAQDGSFMTIITSKKMTKKLEDAVKKQEKMAVLEAKVGEEFRSWVEKSLVEDAQSLKELANL